MIAYLIAPSDASQQENLNIISKMKRQFFTTFLSKIALKNYQFLILIPDLKSSCRDASVGVISNVLWTILILGIFFFFFFLKQVTGEGSSLGKGSYPSHHGRDVEPSGAHCNSWE